MNQTTNDVKLAQIKTTLSGLTKEQRDLLLTQVKNRISQTCSEQNEKAHELTSAQQRMWFLEQLDHVPYLYHVPVILELPTNIQLEHLQKCINVVINQHAQLRSYFADENNLIQQHYDGDVTVDWQEINLPNQLTKIVNAKQDRKLSEFFLKPFDLKKAPLFRLALAKYGQRHYLLLCFHHLIIDAWSVSIFLSQLTEIYNGQNTNENVIPKSYRDFQIFEEKQIQSIHYAKELQYWQTKLNAPWQIDLPYDFPYRKYLSGKGDNLLLHIANVQYLTLKNYAQLRQVSVNHVVLAILQLLLVRYSRQDNIYIGIPLASRDKLAWHKTIGLFVNTCIHARTIDMTQNFATHLAETKRTLLSDIEHAIPFDYLVKYCYEKKICQQATSVNVIYNYIEAEQSDVHLQDQPINTLTTLLPVSKFDLSIHVLKTASGLTFIFEYSSDLFITSTIQQMMNDFAKFLDLFINFDQLSITEIFYMLD